MGTHDLLDYNNFRVSREFLQCFLKLYIILYEKIISQNNRSDFLFAW